MNEAFNPSVMRFMCVICAITLFFPCVQVDCGQEAFYSPMFTSIWGITVLIALGIVFFLCNSSYVAEADVMGLVTGPFGILALFMKASEFEDRLAVKGYESVDVEFMAGYYWAFTLFIALSIYSFISLLVHLNKNL